MNNTFVHKKRIRDDKSKAYKAGNSAEKGNRKKREAPELWDGNTAERILKVISVE